MLSDVTLGSHSREIGFTKCVQFTHSETIKLFLSWWFGNEEMAD